MRNDMKFGGAMFFTEYSMGAPELAVSLEERGFDSVWAPEHSHIPLSRKTPFPGGGELPKQYADAMDPFVVLAAAANATKTIKRVRLAPNRRGSIVSLGNKPGMTRFPWSARVANLGRQIMDDDSPVDTVGPWTIKSMPTELRNRIIKASRQEGLTVSQWLERRVTEWLDDGRTYVCQPRYARVSRHVGQSRPEWDRCVSR